MMNFKTTTGLAIKCASGKNGALLWVFAILGILHISFQRAAAQVNPGPDQTICPGTTTTLGTTGNSTDCYYWQCVVWPTGADCGLETSQKNLVMPEVTPSEPGLYIYELTVIDETFTSRGTAEVRVRVEEPQLTIEVEENIVDCMEGREVTFTIRATENFQGRMNLFSLIYQDEKGTTWTRDEVALGSRLDMTITMDPVPEGVPDHKYSATVHAQIQNEDCEAITVQPVRLDVYELWIDYVRSWDLLPFDWDVVVGETFDYKGIASSDCTDWKWEMIDGFWDPFLGDAQSTEPPFNGTPMLIPDSYLSSMFSIQWDEFGSKYGTMKVSCIDAENVEHQFYSHEMFPPQKVFVFFKGDDTTNPTGSEPNWYYYWREALFSDVPDITWNPARAYAFTLFDGRIEVGEDNGTLDYDQPYDHTGFFGYPRPTLDGKKGIDLFFAAVTHELQHRVDLPFYGNAPDQDGDFLPDDRDPFPTQINGAGYPEYTGAQAWQGDWEYMARMVEDVFAPSTKDWSKGGKQW